MRFFNREPKQPYFSTGKFKPNYRQIEKTVNVETAELDLLDSEDFRDMLTKSQSEKTFNPDVLEIARDRARNRARIEKIGGVVLAVSIVTGLYINHQHAQLDKERGLRQALQIATSINSDLPRDGFNQADISGEPTFMFPNEPKVGEMFIDEVNSNVSVNLTPTTIGECVLTNVSINYSFDSNTELASIKGFTGYDVNGVVRFSNFADLQQKLGSDPCKDPGLTS